MTAVAPSEVGSGTSPSLDAIAARALPTSLAYCGQSSLGQDHQSGRVTMDCNEAKSNTVYGSRTTHLKYGGSTPGGVRRNDPVLPRREPSPPRAAPVLARSTSDLVFWPPTVIARAMRRGIRGLVGAVAACGSSHDSGYMRRSLFYHICKPESDDSIVHGLPCSLCP